ncbi:MAG: hypothetical protein HY327_12845 [Chloroflexi bacterium]|nr:hypothetical protein [Chloroflexota bacterium]
MKSIAFSRFAGIAAMFAGILGVVYSYAFIFLVVRGGAPAPGVLLSSAALLLGGIFSSAALVAVYARVRESDNEFALFALLFGIAGAFGAAIHGGYDLANAINPPDSNIPALANLPSQLDPRGLLTFGFAGVALFVFAGLMRRGALFPKGLAILGSVVGGLLILIYLGRLIILDPNNLLIGIPALLTGFILNPVWYVWLGATLWRAK